MTQGLLSEKKSPYYHLSIKAFYRCHFLIIIIVICFLECDTCKGCYSTAAVGGGVVGGFVGGFLMAAVVAAVIFVVFPRRTRSVHMGIFVAHYYWTCMVS